MIHSHNHWSTIAVSVQSETSLKNLIYPIIIMIECDNLLLLPNQKYCSRKWLLSSNWRAWWKTDLSCVFKFQRKKAIKVLPAFFSQEKLRAFYELLISGNTMDVCHNKELVNLHTRWCPLSCFAKPYFNRGVRQAFLPTRPLINLIDSKVSLSC